MQLIERRILTFLNSFPSVGWAILGVVWFQISTATVLFIQTAIVLPFCIINALAGFRQIDPDLDELGRSLTRSSIRRFFKLTLPLIAPFLIAGIRVAYGICWKIALVSELFGASSGLGLSFNACAIDLRCRNGLCLLPRYRHDLHGNGSLPALGRLWPASRSTRDGTYD